MKKSELMQLIDDCNCKKNATQNPALKRFYQEIIKEYEKQLDK